MGRSLHPSPPSLRGDRLAVLARALLRCCSWWTATGRHPSWWYPTRPPSACSSVISWGSRLHGYRDKLEQSPCGLNILEAPGGEVRLVLYNDVSHYATLLDPVGKRLSPWWA